MNKLFLLATLLWPWSPVTSRGVLHKEGFIEELVASERSFTGAFVANPQDPDTKPPMLLLSMKRGRVHVMTNPDESTTTQQVLDIEHQLCTNGERGFQSIVPHPNFVENNWLYVYYTGFSEGCLEDPVFGPRNRLARMKMDPQTLRIMNETEEILLEGAPTHKFYHNGGSIKFGNDGKIYVSTGDGGGDSTAQDLTNLHGSILRLNDDGSVPSDNPLQFEGGYIGVPCGQTGGALPSDAPRDAVCSEIFSYGFRNPFRMVMDTTETEKTRFYVNDVGGSVWEEISEAGTDFPAKNYGWPRYEGPCRFGKTDDCPLYDQSSTIENRDQNSKPVYFYEHSQEKEGGCISGGAFVPEGIWPPEYKYVYADFIFHKIFNLVEDEENECSTCIPPIPKYQNDTFYTSQRENEDQHLNYERIVDIFFGPYKDTQALYVFKMGSGDNVWRIRYTGSDNIPPVAKIEVESPSVDVGESVAFDGSNSFDPEELELQYEWDFGDGESFSTETSPVHSYQTSGQYTVRLGVTDSADHTQTASVIINVGRPPIGLNITSPAEGDEFFVGEILTLSGMANDAEGEPLDDTQISWEVRKHHADHFHPFLDVKTGNDFSLFPAPVPEDYVAATNSYLEIIMYATGSNGLVSTTTRNVYPRLVELCVDTEPQGLEVFVDEYPIVTPLRITSWVNHNLRLRTPLFQDGNGTIANSTFMAWSDGNIAEDREVRLSTNVHQGILASFCAEGDEPCITAAQSRNAPWVARCPTDPPTESPTESATTAALKSPPEENEQKSVEDEPVEDKPVEEDEPEGKDPVPERPYVGSPYDSDNKEIWELFDQDSGVTLTGTSVFVFLLSSLATLAVMFRI